MQISKRSLGSLLPQSVPNYACLSVCSSHVTNQASQGASRSPLNQTGHPTT